jgi:membrane-bound metal-dependent hydrolase YbcI (DUF457 family)
MTLVGHALTGAAVGVAALPKQASRLRTVIQPAIFIFLANIPDLAIGDWGHGLYYYSHSIFSNLVFIILLLLILTISRKVATRLGGWPVLLGGSLAWLSHLLLDAFYNNEKGYGMFWPISEAHIALPIPWFSVMYGGLIPVTPEKIHILLTELICYLPLLLLAILVRRIGKRIANRQVEPANLPATKAKGEQIET